jgi:hypothetical protein
MNNTQMYQGPQQDTEEAYRQFQAAHPGWGRLRVQVSTAGGMFPVPGAMVEVSRELGGALRLLYRSFTDSSGIVANMLLPALPAEESLRQETAGDGGTAYRVSVYDPGFIPLVGSEVELYDGIETILPVALQPVTR